MKKLFFSFLLIGMFCCPLICEESDDVSFADESEIELISSGSDDEVAEVTGDGDEDEEITAAKGGYAEVPPAKRPRPIDKEKAEAAAEKDETKDDEENFRNTIRYGIPSEIGTLLDKLNKNEDPRFTEEIYDVFQETKNSSIREKILTYFTKLEDPCLEDFAVDLLNDPYDEKNDVVKATFKYVQTCKTKAAVPAVITLIEAENDSYFNDAITTIGEIGGEREALFLAEYLDRDDLSDAQRQSLMRACGKMKALSTWDKLVEILEDDDENTFVRMYAAEGIGLMKADKSVPVLVDNYKANDPNLRQYIIKGLKNYPDVVEAKATIMQAIRDEHWKVRQEAIKAVKELEITESTPFLIYRVKNDSEKVIKDEAINSLGVLNTEEGNKFLVGQVTDKKVGDATKKKVIEVLLREEHAGEEEILELAKKYVTDDTRKDMRYAIGKELAKKYKPSYDEVCALYLESKDTTTVSLGLDMYKSGKSSAVEPKVRTIAEDKKANASNKKRAMKLLGIEEEDLEKKDEAKTDASKQSSTADAK